MSSSDSELRVQIELERSIDCHESVWHTRHDEAKYDRYEAKFQQALSDVLGSEDYLYLRNPGPKAYGMHCKKSPYHKKLWYSMIKSDKTQRWYPDVTFCYPRVGSFEITAVKGKQRVPVFSKLAVRKWPHPEWLAAKVRELVETKLGGWAPLQAAPVVAERKYATKSMSDDELRSLMRSKFSTLIGAFRAFDKNGDGCISKTEFMKGIRNAGVDLPKNQLEQLWAMADEDGTGNLQYQEFARKFSAYKASHSLHRHADYRKDGKQELVQSLHGVDAASRVQKHAAIRESKGDLSWGVAADKLAENPDEVLKELNKSEMSIQQLSRDAEQMGIPAEQMSGDQIRAKIYKKHGNILNAFRHFDFDGSSSIDYEEFVRHLPQVLGETITQSKLEALWKTFDPDLSGEVDMNEFANEKCMTGALKTQQGLATFKGHAVDPTLQFAHQADKNAVLITKTYGVTGANSQVVSMPGTAAGAMKHCPSDASTIASGQSNHPSPQDSLSTPVDSQLPPVSAN